MTESIDFESVREEMDELESVIQDNISLSFQRILGVIEDNADDQNIQWAEVKKQLSLWGYLPNVIDAVCDDDNHPYLKRGTIVVETIWERKLRMLLDTRFKGLTLEDKLIARL